MKNSWVERRNDPLLNIAGVLRVTAGTAPSGAMRRKVSSSGKPASATLFSRAVTRMHPVTAELLIPQTPFRKRPALRAEPKRLFWHAAAAQMPVQGHFSNAQTDFHSLQTKF